MLLEFFLRKKKKKQKKQVPSQVLNCNVFQNKPFKLSTIPDCCLLYTISIFSGNAFLISGRQEILGFEISNIFSCNQNCPPAIASFKAAIYYDGKMSFIFQNCIYKQLFRNIAFLLRQEHLYLQHRSETPTCFSV